MALDPSVADAFANEFRRGELQKKVASLTGQMDAIADVARTVSAASTAAERSLADARSRLLAFEQGAGPGTGSDVGAYSTTDQAMRTERFTGKAAAVDYVKANPAATEDAATAAYRTAALAARPSDRQWLIQDPLALRQEYAANLVAAGYIPDASWESWRAWLLATDREVILGLN